MAGRNSSTNQSTAGKTSRPGGGRPVANLAIMSLAIFFFGRLGITRGWIEWPPSNLGMMLAAFSGWVALAGPFVLFRYEENSGGMGLGDRVWMTSGMLIWLRFALELVSGRVPSWNGIATSVSPTELSVLAAASVLGGMLAKPKQTHWTWTNLMGWGIAMAWLISAALVQNSRLMTLVLR